MDLSEVLLYLDLIKKVKNRAPELPELKMMLYNLHNYDEVSIFLYKMLEYKNISHRFISGNLIHFIEDYDDCLKLKNYILQNPTLRNYPIIFKHQIKLADSKEEALKIIQEARDMGHRIPEEWAGNYNSKWRIIKRQKEWRENISVEEMQQLYEEFSIMKGDYFKNLPLEQLKESLQNEQKELGQNPKIPQAGNFTRSVYIKEFARKVAKGVCQLCEKKAPFLDKYGIPFLEVHHIHYLSKGGSDTVDNVVALCPNCHRRIHQLELVEDTIKIKKKALLHMD